MDTHLNHMVFLLRQLIKLQYFAEVKVVWSNNVLVSENRYVNQFAV